MQALENWTLKGITVYIDGNRFINCILRECKLIYGVGDVMWENTQFINCQLTFDALAQRTIAYLQNFGLMKKPDQITPQSPQANSELAKARLGLRGQRQLLLFPEHLSRKGLQLGSVLPRQRW